MEELLKNSSENNEVNMNDSDILERLADKVDSHDRSLVIVSKAVEDINGNLSKIVKTNDTLSQEMSKHWVHQDRIMEKVQDILSKLSENNDRFKNIETTQIQGCPSLRSFIALREAQLKRYDDVVDSVTTATKRNRAEIEELNEKVSVGIEKSSVANKRIKDLEENQRKGFWIVFSSFLGLVVLSIKLLMEK